MAVGSVGTEPSQARGSGSRPGTVGLCECCAFSCGYPSVCSQLYPSDWYGLLPASSAPPACHVVQSSQPAAIGLAISPFAKGLVLESCLNPLRRGTAAFTRVQHSVRPVQFGIPGFQKVLVEMCYKIRESQQFTVGNRFS